MMLAPGARLGVHEIAGLIGAGGMGEVCRAHDPHLNRHVAIKALWSHLRAAWTTAAMSAVGCVAAVALGVSTYSSETPDGRRFVFSARNGGLLPAHPLAQPAVRPVRIVLIVDSTEAIRQPLGSIRTFPSGNLTDLPVTLMIGRDTGGAYTTISPNGLLDVLQRLAVAINNAA